MRILRKGEPVWISASTLFVRGHQKGLSTTIHLVRESWDPRGLEGHLQELLARLEKHPLAEKESLDAKAMPPLSPREREVLSCLSRGQHAKEIARQLGVSPSTVRSHVKTILCKLEVHSQLEAVAHAFQHHLL
ncbi:MAG: helix-turn-helix transcriptional regulator [Nitrospirae bacterium]|nr:helix-turn-helix transcriptional regulator [Nitrospirota bacterium]